MDSLKPFHEGINLMFSLHREKKANGDSAKSEDICERLDILYKQMTDDQRDAVAFISELLANKR